MSAMVTTLAAGVVAVFFFFKQKTAYEIMPSLVGSEMCIRDRYHPYCITAWPGGRSRAGGLLRLEGRDHSTREGHGRGPCRAKYPSQFAVAGRRRDSAAGTTVRRYGNCPPRRRPQALAEPAWPAGRNRPGGPVSRQRCSELHDRRRHAGRRRLHNDLRQRAFRLPAKDGRHGCARVALAPGPHIDRMEKLGNMLVEGRRVFEIDGVAGVRHHDERGGRNCALNEKPWLETE